MLEIRAEEAADVDAIRQVNLEAFGQHAEADLVEALRAAGKASVSTRYASTEAVSAARSIRSACSERSGPSPASCG